MSARLVGLLTRLSLLVRGRLVRLAGAALLTTTVVGLVLAIPVVSGADSFAPVSLDASSSSSAAADDEVSSPVVMGLDGRPATSSSTGESSPGPAGTTTHADSPAAEDSPPVAAAPDTTGSAPASSPVAEGSTSSSSSPSSSSPSTSSPSSPGTTAPGTRTPDSTPANPTPPAEPEQEPTVEPADLTGKAADALALVNAARTDVGCGALAADAPLTTAAEAHSAEMSASGLMDLDGLTGAVAQGRPNAQSAVSEWLGDPATSGVLLDCSRTAAGIGVVDGWWTVLVA